jgi:hypothetical protein
MIRAVGGERQGPVRGGLDGWAPARDVRALLGRGIALAAGAG